MELIMIVITNENLEDYINGELPFVLDFWAEWCGQCKALTPTITSLDEEYKDKIVVGKCNIEENEDIISKYNIRNLPTILFFKNGEVIDKIIGVPIKSVLIEKFNSLL